MLQSRHLFVGTFLFHFIPIAFVWYFYYFFYPETHPLITDTTANFIPFFSNFMAFSPMHTFSKYANFLNCICLFCCLWRDNDRYVSVIGMIVSTSLIGVGWFPHTTQPIPHYICTGITFISYNIYTIMDITRRNITDTSLLKTTVVLLICTAITILFCGVSGLLMLLNNSTVKYTKSIAAIFELLGIFIGCKITFKLHELKE